jgi:hypothetical protein
VVWDDLKGFFGGLAAAFGNGRESWPEDVVKVKHAMRGLGRYPRADEPHGILDPALDRAIRGYQADRRLKQDGWLAPKGETAREIGADLGLLQLVADPEPAVRDAEARMRGTARSFNTFGWLGERLGLGDLGFKRAGEHLDHYLGASGTPRTLTSKEVDAEPALRHAERANRAKFEAQTFTANTRDDTLNRFVRNLPNRAPAVDFEDNFEIGPSFWDYLRRPGNYFAWGRAGVRSDLKSKVKRVGDRIGLEGWVTHRLDNRGREDNDKGRFSDTYDFEPSQPGGAEARLLEPRGRARPFDMGYERKQSVTAILRRGPDGSLTLERAIWGDPQ